MLPACPLTSAWAETWATPYPFALPAGTNTAVSVMTERPLVLIKVRPAGKVWEITEPLVIVSVPCAVVAG